MKRQRDATGKYLTDREQPKTPRNTRLTDACWDGLQLLADHYGDRSRAEFLERYVREECERLGIKIEPKVKPGTSKEVAA